jgi:type VI secretion system protein ImpK
MRLADCFSELFAYVGYFLKSRDLERVTFDELQTNIHRLLSETMTYVARNIVTLDDYDLARFALCAWVDEAVLSSEWPAKDRWAREQLQRKYYQTTKAGEEFFDRLNSLGFQQPEVREVYYLCLAMGFKGRFCHEGDDFLLEQLKVSNLKVLLGSSMGLPSLERTRLFPEAYPPDAEGVELEHENSGFSLMTAALLVGPIVLLALIYFLFGVLLGMRVEDFSL